jgi:predicted Fe-S protein YdhL (DUF1289 family)
MQASTPEPSDPPAGLPLPARVEAAVRESRPVPSPCLSICRMDEQTGWCEGCWRTLDEIATWGTVSDARRLAIWQAVLRRQTSQT